MLVALAVILGGIWLLLGFVCTLRIIGRMADGNTQTLLLILIFTHFVGLGFLFAGGMVWAAWIMVASPFKLFTDKKTTPAPATIGPPNLNVYPANGWLCLPIHISGRWDHLLCDPRDAQEAMNGGNVLFEEADTMFQWNGRFLESCIPDAA